MRLLAAALVLSAPAAAQEPIVAPAGFVPKQAMTVDDGTGHAASVTPASPLPTAPKGAPAIATGQVSVGTVATPIVAARPGRQRILVNVLAATTCAFGGPGVTVSTGYQLQPIAGASQSFNTSAAIYGACSSPTTVSFAEEF